MKNVNRFANKIKLLMGILCLILLAGCKQSSEEVIKKQLELGHRYLEEMKYEEAIIAFNKVIEIDPANTDAYIYLSKVFEEQNEYEKALEMERIVVDLLESSENQTLLTERKIHQAVLYAKHGEIDGGLAVVDSIKETDENAWQEARSEIIALLFTGDFIKPEEITVNDKPFWMSELSDAIAAYPCDDPDDVKINENSVEPTEDYYAYKSDGNEDRAGNAKFRKNLGESGLSQIIFANKSLHLIRHGIGEPVDFKPDLYQPEFRGIKLNEPYKEALKHIGYSEIGIKYLEAHNTLTFIYDRDLWTIYVSEETEVPPGLNIIWKIEDGYDISIEIMRNENNEVSMVSARRERR